jgi:hypothetical protein
MMNPPEPPPNSVNIIFSSSPAEPSSSANTVPGYALAPPSEVAGVALEQRAGVSVGLYLAEVWATRRSSWTGKPTTIPGEAERIFSGFTRDHGWRPFERVEAALVKLAGPGRKPALKALEALGELPAWNCGSESEYAIPHGIDIAHADKERSVLTEAVKQLRRGGAYFHWMANTLGERGEPFPEWLKKSWDDFERAWWTLAGHQEHLDQLLKGTAPTRINTSYLQGLNDPNGASPTTPYPQAWKKLRTAAADLALRLHRATQVGRKRVDLDSRLVHGAFRAEVVTCVVEIIDALYEVKLRPEDVKADLRSIQRRSQRRRDEGVV